MITFYDEDLDEIPVDPTFLVSADADAGVFGGEECDPLMIDSCVGSAQSVPVQDPLECTPTTTNQPLEVKIITVGGTRRSPRRNVLSASKSLPSANNTLCNTSSLTKVPVQKPTKMAAKKTPTRSLNDFKTLTFSEFTQEMQQNIQDIVKEAIGLFDLNPREYHPFYLRIFKYVTIGQKLGFVAADEAYVSSVWTGFFKFADAQYEASRKRSVSFAGDKSPYATYILTRKLVVNGKEISEQRDQVQVRKNFEQVEAKAKMIRDEWDARASPQKIIANDYKARLKFFKECMTFTHPADCVKMNKLWSKFLSTEGFSEWRPREREPVYRVDKVKMESPIPVVTTPSEDEDDKGGDSASNEDEQGRKAFKKLIIKVIVAPPSSPVLTSAKTEGKVPSVPRCKSPSPPCSPANHAALSPPPSPEPISPPPQASTCDKSESPTEKSDKNTRVQRKSLKLTATSKSCRNGEGIRGKNLCAKPTKRLMISTNVLKKKKSKLFSVLSACSKMRSSNEQQRVSRQLQMEKVINQRKSKLLSAIAKKKKAKHVLRNKQKLEQESLSKISRTLSSKPSSPSHRNNKTKTRKIVKKMVKKTSKKPGALTTKFNNRLVEKRKRRKSLLEMKKVNSDILQGRLEKKAVNLNGAKPNSEEQDEGSIQDRKLMDIERQQSYDNSRRKYAKVQAICPIVNCGKELTLQDIANHLKANHGIEEFGEMWECPFCSREIAMRWNWLAHIEAEATRRGYEVDMEKMVEVTKKQHAEIDWTELKNMVSIVSKQKLKLAPQFIVNPITSKDPFERCEECCVNLVVGYLVVHKEGAHNPDRYWAKCQVCERKFYEHRRVWNHYCESHLDDSHPLKSLDPAVSDKVLRFMEEEKERQLAKPRHKSRPTSHPPAQPLSCKECDRSFSTPGALNGHMTKIHGEAAKEVNLQCSYCQKVFTQRDTLKAHVNRLHLGKVKSKCPKCSNELQTPGKLWRHLIDKHGESAFEAAAYCEVTFIPCTYCGLELLEGRQYQNHMLKQHPDTFEKLPVQFDLKCPHCPEAFRMKKSLNAHIQLLHEEISKCDRCNGKDFKTPGKLWRHLIDAHQVSVSEAAAQCKVDFTPCTYCGQELLEGKESENHVKVEHPEHFEEFITAERLAKIERIKSGGPVRRARVRTEDYREAQRIKERETRQRQKEQGIVPAHVQRKKERRRLKGNSREGKSSSSSVAEFCWCLECGQRISNSKFVLARHMKLVHGINMDANQQNRPCCPFEGCSAYFSRDNLKKHVRNVHTTHIEQRIIDKKIVKLVEETRFCVIHLCTLCGVYLFHFDEVKVHMFDSHPEIFADLVEGASPVELPCPHCPSKYPVEDDVRCHVELAHPEICWRCPECAKVMISPDDFDKHFVKEHSTQEEQPEKNAQEEGFIVRAIRTRIRTADKNRDLRRIRRHEHDGQKRKQRTKLRSIGVACEICGAEISLGALVQHLDKVHGLVEDGDPIACTKCEDSAEFIITSHDGRCSFVNHMETVHQSSEAEMEEIIKMMGKIHTKVNWQTLEIKNPQGLAVRRQKCKTTDDKEPKRKQRPTVTTRLTKTNTYVLADRESCLQKKRHIYSVFYKYGQLPTKCPLASCGNEFLLNKLSSHLKTRHNIDEQGKAWACPLCGKDTLMRRDSWLGHIERIHGKEANMEQLITKARKVHPDVQVTEPTSENNEPVGGGNRTRRGVGCRGKKQPVAVTVRVSGRKRSRPGKYAKYLDNDDDEELSEYEKSANADIEMKKRRRKVGRAKSSATKGKNKTSCESSNKHNIELEKKLVIRLVRLTKDELLIHLRKGDGEKQMNS